MPRSSTALSWLALFMWSTTLGAAQSPPAPAIIHIPLTASSDNQRYFANVNMSVGDQTQRFGFALSTTTGYTVVADTSCVSCANNSIPTYNQNQSNTAKSLGSEQQQVSIAGGVVNAGGGKLSKEDCALHQANGSFWQYPNQTIVQANSSAVFQAGVSGLIGLGTNAANFDDTVFAGWLSRNPAQPNFTFGLALNPLAGTQAQAPAGGDPSDSTKVAGTLHMQSPDPLSYTGEIQWQSVPSPDTAAANSTGVTVGDLGGSSWLIHMDGWNFTAGGAQTSNVVGGLAAVEPFFANIFLPNAQANQLYAALPGAHAQSTTSSDIGQTYSIPCDADITFSAVLSGQEYLVPKEALVVQAGDGSCTGAIEGWADASATNFLLGSRFISTVYMVFQVGHPPGVQQQIGLAQRVKGNKSKPPVGGIVGGVVGGVAFLLIVGGALFWWVRKQKRSSAHVTGVHGSERSGTMDEKMGSPLSSSKDGYVVDHWAPSSVPHTPSNAHTAATPETHYTSIGTPTTANFSPPVSAAVHESFFPGADTPPGTATSEHFLAPPQPGLKVNQWVTGMQPTPARPHVPSQYDYGNRGEPGQLAPPTFPDESEGGRLGPGGPDNRESYASSTLAAPSESWKPDHSMK